MFTKFKKLLASRKLFSNWLTAGVKYYLASRGLIPLKNIEVVCRNSNRASIPLEAYRTVVNDYWDGLLIVFDGRVATYIRGVRVPIEELDKSDNVGRAIAHGWSFNGKYWFKGNVKFVHMHGTILGIFEHGCYSDTDVNGKVVVDVGAYVGDSAIYFALRGARKVIAIEPHLIAYTEMIENIKFNDLEDVIIPVNAGLASKPGRLRIKGADIRSTVSTYYAPSCNGSIPVITLGDVLSKYDIRDRSVLKLNCQGCEYDVVLNDYEHVRMFEEVIIEYHTGAVVLFRNLSKDFECHILKEINDDQGLMKCISARSRS
jgi:FkbM family methyltransferase